MNESHSQCGRWLWSNTLSSGRVQRIVSVKGQKNWPNASFWLSHANREAQARRDLAVVQRSRGLASHIRDASSDQLEAVHD